MRITKNTSGYDAKALRALICLAHQYIRRFEGRAAPNWKGLRVVVRGRSAHYTTGCAYLGGRGNARFDVCLTVPRTGLKAREFLSLAHHELMHTYGFRHEQYRDLNAAELEELIPNDYELAKATAPRKPTPTERTQAKIISLLERQAQWESRLVRAQRALQKLSKSLRYYEKHKPELLAAAAPVALRRRKKGSAGVQYLSSES